MRPLLIVSWLAVSFTGPTPLPQEPGSAITGVVKFEGAYKPRKLNAEIDQAKHGGPGRDGKDVFDEIVVLGSNQELANVMVCIKGPVAGHYVAPKEPVELDVRGYFFSPRVIVVRTNQKLRLKNSGFNSLSVRGQAKQNQQFNVGILKGAHYDVSFRNSEFAIPVNHDCCPWMIAWIHVLDHPFFAVSGLDGAFRIAGLPAGKYEVEAWHEKFGTRTATVTVGEKEAKTLDFTFKSENK